MKSNRAERMNRPARLDSPAWVSNAGFLREFLPRARCHRLESPLIERLRKSGERFVETPLFGQRLHQLRRCSLMPEEICPSPHTAITRDLVVFETLHRCDDRCITNMRLYLRLRRDRRAIVANAL